MCGVTPNNGEVRLSRSHVNSQEDEEDDFILVPCKVGGSYLKIIFKHKISVNCLYKGFFSFFLLLSYMHLPSV